MLFKTKTPATPPRAGAFIVSVGTPGGVVWLVLNRLDNTIIAWFRLEGASEII